MSSPKRGSIVNSESESTTKAVYNFLLLDQCRECAYFRQALFAHQGVNGQNHLFDIRNTMFNCDGCMKLLNGTDFFYCIACRHDKGNGYELVSLLGNESPVLPLPLFFTLSFSAPSAIGAQGDLLIHIL